jgi:hypothetical protein
VVVATRTSCPPRIRHVPKARATRGDEALDIAERCGLIADDHQREVILAFCQIDKAGKWATLENVINEPRQNGKGAILEIRELAGLFAWEDNFIVHSAHQVDTSLEHFERILALIESVPEFDQQVKRVSRQNGHEGVHLKDGSRLRFRARSAKGGRGFSCDTLVLDEAMFLPQAFHGALFPTLRARKNPQVLYAGSAVDQEIHEHGIVFTRLRERAIKGDDPSLCYFEWSLDYEHPSEVPPEVAADPEMWEKCNPALGDRISAEHMEEEQRALDERTFAVELLGVGDYPNTDGSSEQVFEAEQWAALEDEHSVIRDPVCLGFDISPQHRASISACGRNHEGHWGVEVIDRRPGVNWLVERLVELDAAHSPLQIVCDSKGLSASLIQALDVSGVRVRRLTTDEFGQACGRFVDAVAEETLRHPGGQVLWNSIRGARTRPLGDRWIWSRRSSTVDISALVATTLALWSAQNEVPDDTGDLEIF